ncbi:MAG: hypothetical protein ACHP9Z_25175 [Streptosporangiales bacterium]
MSSIALAVTDSATMLRRNLRHMRRYPSVPLLITGLPGSLYRTRPVPAN